MAGLTVSAMKTDDDFLEAIRANPADESPRLAYADWLDQRRDTRGDFLRLQLRLKSVAPDHVLREKWEGDLSRLRLGYDAGWLAVIEPERVPHPDDPQRWLPTCGCFDYSVPQWREVDFHRETQD